MPAKGDPRRWLSARLRPGDIVIDAGANVGECAKEFADIIGDAGVVFALEPDPRCYEVFPRDPRIQLLMVAAGEGCGMTTFYQGNESPQSSRFAEAILERLDHQSVQVPMMPLDAVTTRPVAAVKIDVQGGESAVLRGASRLLRECPLWVIELWPWGVARAQESPESLVTPFVEAGLVPRYLSEDDPVPTPADLLAYLSTVTAPNEHINVAWVRP